MRFTTSLLVAGFLLLAAARPSSAQVVLTWGGASNGTWTTSTNWSTAIVPNNLTLHDALISATGAAYTVTANGASSLAVRKLDVTSANVTLVFNFSSASPGLTL